MSAAPPPPGEAELHAYVDGHLPADRVAVVELGSPPTPRPAPGRTPGAQNDLINRLYDGEARTPLPVRRTADRLLRERHRGRWRIAAAVLLALLAGSGTGWLANDFFSATPEPTDGLARAGVALHQMAPGEGPAGLAERDEGRMAAQLSRSLGHPVEIPDLAQVGLRLVGGRALPLAVGQAAAQLTYEDDAGARFTLYLVRPAPPKPATSARSTTRGSPASSGLTRNSTACWSGRPRARLLVIAQAVQTQLDAENAFES